MYGDGSIWQDSKTKKWKYKYVDSAQKQHRLTFDTSAEAKAAMKKIRGAKDSGQITTQITLGAWVVEYIDTYCKPNIKESSLQRIKQSAKKIAPIANIKLSEITGRDIQTLYNSYSDVLSSSSISKVHKLLNAAYKKAMALRMIVYNPVDAVEPVKVKTKDIEIFTFSEIRKIFRTIKKDKYYAKYYLLFLTALVTGCRIGEILAIRWENINFNQAELKITSAKKNGSGQIFGDTKTVAGKRTIPFVFPSYVQKLKEYRSRDNIIRLNGLVFCTKTDKALNHTNVERVWRNIIAVAGIEKNIHVFRHTFATHMLAKGIPILEVSRCLGHTEASTTLNMYGHAIQGYNQKIKEIFAANTALKKQSHL